MRRFSSKSLLAALYGPSLRLREPSSAASASLLSRLCFSSSSGVRQCEATDCTSLAHAEDAHHEVAPHSTASSTTSGKRKSQSTLQQQQSTGTRKRRYERRHPPTATSSRQTGQSAAATVPATPVRAVLAKGKASTMRRRKANEDKARRGANQEELLLQALTTVNDIARGRHALPHTQSADSLNEPEKHRRSDDSLVGGSADSLQSVFAEDGTKPTVSANRLTAQVTASNFVVKLQGQLSAMTAPLLGWWTRGPSDSTLRRLERQVELASWQDSLDAYASLRASMRGRFDDPLIHLGKADTSSTLNCSDARFLLLYARLLVNYGTLSLLKAEPQQAISLLREAIATATAAGAVTGKSRSEKSDEEARPCCGPTSLLYVRMILANALSCERLYWQAAEQYVEVLRVLDENPLDDAPSPSATGDSEDPLAQLSPGKSFLMPLARACLREDAELFFKDPARLSKAISQGQAHELLLQAQGTSSSALSRVRLTMARLCRYGSAFTTTASSSAKGKRFAQTPASLLRDSRELYESYLDDLVSREEEDTEHAMLELGRMLCANPAAAAGDGVSLNDTAAISKQLEAGLIYLEAASETFLEESELAFVSGNASPDHAQKQLVVRTASILVDTAEAHLCNENEAAALGLFEGALTLLNRANLRDVSAWVLQRYADTLSSVSFVDKAILKYTAAMEILRANEHFGLSDVAVEDGFAEAATDPTQLTSSASASTLASAAPLQLGAHQRFVNLTSVDVEASLAYCYQMYVGDARRALWHYEHVLDSLLPRTKKMNDAGEAGAPNAAGFSHRGKRPRRSAPMASLMPLEREHYVLTNMVACCERLQDWDNAVIAQNRIVALETVLSGSAIPACLRSVALMEKKGDSVGMIGVLFFLLLLPAEEMEASVRLSVIHYFVRSCYAIGNKTMGCVLLSAARQVEGDNDLAVMLEWAMLAKNLDPSEQLTVYDAVEMRTDVNTVRDTFQRAAQMLVASCVSESADMAAVERRSCDAGSSVHDDNREYDSIFVPEPKKGPAAVVDAKGASLILLSRGAFFFHQNGFSKQAEDLYSMAVALADKAKIPQAAGSEVSDELSERYNEYNRELAILLTNYATLKLSTDPALAEKLYTRAATTRLAPLEVAEVLADYFLHSGNYAQGAAHMTRVIEAYPESAVEMHSRLARLGCGPHWATLTAAQRLEVHEHLVLGLGVDPLRVPKYVEGDATTDANLAERLEKLDALTLHGVATSAGDEATCLACFLMQTKYSQKVRLINQMYTHALKRFPFHTAILVNYAKFCCDYNFHALARKLYARAYGAADGDFCRTSCYANYLSHAFGSRQSAAGESLYRYHLEKEPASSQAHMHYANYLAVMMSIPALAERHFEKGVELDPQSKYMGLYAQFIWSCAVNSVSYQGRDPDTNLLDRAEVLFKRAVDIGPEDPVALQNLGVFYASCRNRFPEAIATLYKAHRLAPSNVEVVHHLSNVLLEECLRVQTAEQQRYRGAAKQGVSDGAANAAVSTSPRLRALAESTEQVFNRSIELDPTHRETLEKYANFAVTVLKNPSLAVSLWSRINRLSGK